MWCGYFGHLQVYCPIQWVPGKKWPGREADHSPPSDAEVNVRGYTSTPQIRLHDVMLI
jgi:hypothetical protein